MSTTAELADTSARCEVLLDRLRDFAFDEPGATRPMTRRLAEEQGWSSAYTARVMEEYRRFLVLSQIAGHPVSPSQTVDEAWHAHLLYTRSYWDGLCKEVLGRPLHHQPSKGGDVESAHFLDQYAQTIVSYTTWFGPPPADIWPAPRRRDPPPGGGGSGGGPGGNGPGGSGSGGDGEHDGRSPRPPTQPRRRWSALVVGLVVAAIGRALVLSPIGPMDIPFRSLAAISVMATVTIGVYVRHAVVRRSSPWISPLTTIPPTASRSEEVDMSNALLMFVPCVGLAAIASLSGVITTELGNLPLVVTLLTALVATRVAVVEGLMSQPGSTGRALGAMLLAAAGPLTVLTDGWVVALVAGTLLVSLEVKQRFLTPAYLADELSDEELAVLARIDRPHHLARATIAQMLDDGLLVGIGPDRVALAPPFPGQTRVAPTGMAWRVTELMRAHGGTGSIDEVANGLPWEPEAARRRLIASGRLLAPRPLIRLARFAVLALPLVLVSWLSEPAPGPAMTTGLAITVCALGRTVAIGLFFVGLISECMPIRRTAHGRRELLDLRRALHDKAPDVAELASSVPYAMAASWMLFATSGSIRRAGLSDLARIPNSTLAPLTSSLRTFGHCGGGCISGLAGGGDGGGCSGG